MITRRDNKKHGHNLNSHIFMKTALYSIGGSLIWLSILQTSLSSPEDLPDSITQLSWIKTAIDPSRYHSKQIAAEGWLRVTRTSTGLEAWLYESEEAFRYRRPLRALVIEGKSIEHLLVAEGYESTQYLIDMNGRYVNICGVFNEINDMHDSIYLGTIKSVTSLSIPIESGGWPYPQNSFTK